MVDQSLSTGWQVLPSVFIWTPLTHNSIFSQNGMEENNVVYPGEENVTVTLSPGDIDCQSVTDNSCNAIITEEIDYVISVKLTNDFGSSMPDTKLFNCKFSLFKCFT